MPPKRHAYRPKDGKGTKKASGGANGTDAKSNLRKVASPKRNGGATSQDENNEVLYKIKYVNTVGNSASNQLAARKKKSTVQKENKNGLV